MHRDIKPANVVVSRAGTTFDFVKVLDFGLVKLDSGRDTDTDLVKLSADDSWSGTPGYMAPEVVLGAADTDHRVDLYALGCVAYWLLTGRIVFEAENAMQVMVQHVHAEPKRPSTRVDQPIPGALEELVVECLEKDPGRRARTGARHRLLTVSERLDGVSNRDTTLGTAPYRSGSLAAFRSARHLVSIVPRSDANGPAGPSPCPLDHGGH